MAFNQRLIVFDMDGTLIANSSTRLNGCAHECLQLMYMDVPIYIYIRPYMIETLIRCRNDPRNILVLFSSGSFEYVHAVINQVIYPVVRKVDIDFSFTCIFTRDDMEGMFIKPVGLISKELKAEDSILIDDLYEFCINSGAPNYYLINQFNAKNPTDDALQHMMEAPFFS